MSSELLNNFLKMGTISIPTYLLSNYRKMNITSDELIMVIYLLNRGLKISFNPKVIGHDLNMEEKDVLAMLNRLQEKKLVEVEIIKNEYKVMAEYISLEPFYHKLSVLIMGDKTKGDKNNLFEIFESEFGRTLSPMEYEIINAWISTGFKEEIILEALREAIYNGVSNLRYIDKILFEWQKKGFKTVADVRKHNKDFKKSKTEPKELFDYNWLEEE